MKYFYNLFIPTMLNYSVSVSSKNTIIDNDNFMAHTRVRYTIYTVYSNLNVTWNNVMDR